MAGKVELDRSKARVVVAVATRDELDEAARTVLRNIQEECPVQTGRLLASHRIEKPSEDVRIISANTRYARDVYDGKQGRTPNRWMQRGADRSRI